MDAPFLVFPHQLFKSALSASKNTVFYLIEDEHFFRSRNVLKERLLFHRASMQAFRERLLIRGNTVNYCDTIGFPNLKSVINLLQANGVTEVRWHALRFPELEGQLLTLCEQAGIDWHVLPSPIQQHFLLPDVQAKRLKLLSLPVTWHPEPNRYVEDAAEFVEKYFTKQSGSTQNFVFPVTYDDAQDWLEDFLTHHLALFAQFGGTLFRQSPLPLLLGIGLLTSDQVEKTAREFGKQHKFSAQALHALLRLIAE
jgi:deoxyribodipyrimidine photolyase-related protein